MAVSSVLNLEAIIGGPKASPKRFQNFITGGSPIGSSVVNSAANNIVGFQRSSVRPQFPDINSIINSINNTVDNSISNITNLTNKNIDSEINALRNELYAEIGKNKTLNVTQLQTVVQNIQNQANQTLQKSLSNFSRDYQDRIKQVDDAKPTGILGKFLSVYRTAIDFINFFGNKKNINTLRDNLDILKKSFNETFEVAKLVRNVIIKIVKQLSSLPTASPSGGGGINIDVDVPRGGLKKTAPRGLGSMFMGKGKFLGLGLGALGLGVGGTAAVNALSDSGETQYSSISTDISGDSINRLQEIIQRFSFSIDSLLRGVGQSQKISVSSSGGETPKPTTDKEPTSGKTVSFAPGDEKLAAFVASMEASSPENAADALQVMLNRSSSGKYGKGLSEVLSGYDQFSPISAAIYGDSEDPDAKRKYGPIASKLPGNSAQEKFKYLQQVASEPDGLNKLQKIFSGGSSSVSATILNDPKYLEMSRQNVKGALNFYGGKQNNSSDIQVRPGGNWFYNFTGPVGRLGSQPSATIEPQSKLTVAPDTSKQQAVQEAAQKVAQPPPSQQQGQVNIIPIGLGGQQQQSSGGGTLTPPPATKKSGPTVPILPSNNPDNFLVLYSRMVYNVVDG